MIYPGFIMARLARWGREHAERVKDEPSANILTIDNHQCNGGYCVHQASVRLSRDETLYRMIIAPADAPLTLYGKPIDECFAKPLADWPVETEGDDSDA